MIWIPTIIQNYMFSESTFLKMKKKNIKKILLRVFVHFLRQNMEEENNS